MFGNLFPYSRYHLRSVYGMHPDNKENNGKKDKSELGNIEKYTIYNREEERIDEVDDRIDEEK